jgi:large subunit ribosomal protein L32e
MPQFVKKEIYSFSRLGRTRKKLRKWRRPRGKSNKIRLGRSGNPVGVAVGFKTPRKELGRVMGLIPKLVHNIRELESLTKDNVAILARVGARKKLEIIKKADELKIKISNLGSKK